MADFHANSRRLGFLMVAMSILIVAGSLGSVFFLKSNFSKNHGRVLGDASWYNYDWAYRTAITIDNSKVDADLTNFPVLVSSTNADWADTDNGGYVAQADGGDFVFTASDNITKLSHEIEKYDNTTGQLIAWVKVPTLANVSDTVINLYYDNASSENQWSVASTWSSYNNIWHMNEDPSAGTLTDSTGALNGAVVGSWVAGDRADGKINQGWNFSGTNDEEVNLGNIDASVTTQFTFSAWFKADGTAQSGHRLIGNPLDINGPAIVLYDNVLYYRMAIGGGAVADKTVAFTDTASYHHLVFTWDGSNTHSYLDGAELAPAVAAATYGDSTGSILGGRGAADQNFDGMIDEARFDNAAKSAEWIDAEYNNQNSPATFYNLGATEEGDSTPPTNPTSFLGYNTSGKTVSLTTDTWYNYTVPYFEFSGAADGESGVKGYYIYFGTAAAADPYTLGTYQAHVGVAGATQSYTVSGSLTAGETYYLRLITENNGTSNTRSTTANEFTYKYDPTAPSAPEYVNVSPVGCSTNTSFTFTWLAGVDTGGSDIAGYDYKRGSTGTLQQTTELSASATSYQEGDNVFYVRSKDTAGNTSAWQTGIYCSTATVQVADGPNVTAGPSTMTVTWTSNKNTTSYVQVYEGNTYISEQGQTSYTMAHSVKVVGLEPEKSYRYKLVWTDESGNIGEGEWYTTTTSTAPQINDLKVDLLGPTSANISWKDSISAINTIQYGEGAYSTAIETSGYATTGSYKLENLTSGITYQLRINATSEDSTKFFAGTSFTMPPLPEISGVSYELDSNESIQARVSWTTNVDTTTSIFYGVGSPASEIATTERVKVHSVTIPSLGNSENYQFYVAGTDQYGNTAKSSILNFSTPADRRPPTISDVITETSNVGLNKQDKAQIIVSWKTDEPSSSYLEYDKGLSGTDYKQKTAEEKSMTNSHLVIVSDLEPSQPYHLRVVSSDVGGNTASSEDIAIIAGNVPKSIFQIITNTFENVFGWMGKFI